MTSTSDEGQAQESKHPGWQRLGDVLKPPIPAFEDVLLLPSFDNLASNIYVIPGDDLTIVDTGNDYTAFMDLFQSRAKPEDVKKVVLTHGHPDHGMGVFELLRYPSVAKGRGFELILHEAAPPQFEQVARDRGCRVTFVRGGEVLELGGLPWEVIHTPGHTIDGICLYHAPTKTAFTGDTVLVEAMADVDKSAGGRLDHYLFGVKALLKREIENVFPGHGLPVASGGRRVVEETYEALMMRILGVDTQIPWVEGGKALAQKGLLEEAVFCCDRQLAGNSEDQTSLELKAVCLNDLGRSREALDVLDNLGRLRSSEDSFIHVGRGYALMGLGQYDESIECFEAALRLRPDMRDALVYKGMALHLAGHHEEAMDIEPFRTEFVGRFKQELLEKTKPDPNERPRS